MAGVPRATYKLEVYWNGGLNVDPAGTWTGTLVNVSDYLDLGQTPITFTRGKTDLLGSVQAAQCSAGLVDPTGQFNPALASSPLNGLVLPHCGFRLSATYASTTYRLFFGWTNRVRETVSRRGAVAITATDIMDRIQAQKVKGILSILSTITNTGSALAYFSTFIPWTHTNFQPGISVDPLQKIVTVGEQTALLDLMMAYVDPSLGTLYQRADGTLAFVGRGAAYQGGGGGGGGGFTPVATITNTMTQISSEVDISTVINRAQATKTIPDNANYKPIPQTVNDTASQTRYGIRDWAMSSAYWRDDASALSAANFIISRFKSPLVRPRQITIEARDATTMTAALLVDVGDVVTVTEGQTGTTGTYVVWGLSTSIGGTPFKHTTTWTLVPTGV